MASFWGAGLGCSFCSCYCYSHELSIFLRSGRALGLSSSCSYFTKVSSIFFGSGIILGFSSCFAGSYLIQDGVASFWVADLATWAWFCWIFCSNMLVFSLPGAGLAAWAWFCWIFCSKMAVFSLRIGYSTGFTVSVLTGSVFTGSVLTGSVLIGSVLIGWVLTGSVFTGSVLTGSVFIVAPVVEPAGLSAVLNGFSAAFGDSSFGFCQGLGWVVVAA